MLGSSASFFVLMLLTVSVHSSPNASKRAGSAARGSGASGARTSFGSMATGRSGSVINPDSGFSSSGGFPGASTVRKAVSGFTNSIVKARDKISYSMKNVVRPKAKVPRPDISRPVAPLYNPSYGYTHSGRNKGFSAGKVAVAGVGGYFLGRMISRATAINHPQPYYYETYVPFRSRFSPIPATVTTFSPKTALPKNIKNTDVCMLHRWNQELPFTEIPNMAMEFLANDTISGDDWATKAGFMEDFLQRTRTSYGNLDTRAAVFSISPSTNLSLCKFKSTEEPIDVAIKHMWGQYSTSSANPDILNELVESLQVCLPRGSENVTAKIYPCLDYSIEPDQVLKLVHADSIFNNDELCKKYLSPRLLDCEPRDANRKCTIHHLLSINMFARNFYLCSESVHPDTVYVLQDDAYLREYDLASGDAAPTARFAWDKNWIFHLTLWHAAFIISPSF